MISTSIKPCKAKTVQQKLMTAGVAVRGGRMVVDQKIRATVRCDQKPRAAERCLVSQELRELGALALRFSATFRRLAKS